jgi:hypothetical protein
MKRKRLKKNKYLPLLLKQKKIEVLHTSEREGEPKLRTWGGRTNSKSPLILDGNCCILFRMLNFNLNKVWFSILPFPSHAVSIYVVVDISFNFRNLMCSVIDF